MSDRISESSIARMAGNIAAGLVGPGTYFTDGNLALLAEKSVRLARAIAAEVQRTVPLPPGQAE